LTNDLVLSDAAENIKNSATRFNHTKAELDALVQMTLDESIRIFSTDKNLGPIVTDESWYHDEAFRQLEDKASYREVTRDEALSLIADYHDKLMALRPRLQAVIGNQKHLDFIFDSLSEVFADPRFAGFSLFPKVHKNGIIKGRPISSSPGTITHALSVWLDFVLQPLVKQTFTFLKDSKSLVNIVEDLPLPEDVVLATADVTSLYPFIPTIEGISRVCDVLLELGMN
jgi:hypothetical protein